MTKKHLYIPHRSRHVPKEAWVDYSGPIKARWRVLADQKGFRIDRRVRDRLHLVLECEVCAAHTAHKRYTVTDAQPRCMGCQEAVRQDQARMVGVELLDRDEDNHKYNLYRLSCGHESLLQTGHVEKVLKQGSAPGRTGFHCPICATQKLQATAAEAGWRLVGPDPEDKANYRLFAHERCGHQQRVATANLKTARFDCGSCGESWAAAPSGLYLMRFRVPGQGRFVKLGYSRNPVSRLRYQLGLPSEVEAELLDVIDMASGQRALQTEKSLHRQLKSEHPDKVISPEQLKGWINVTSEVYAAELAPVIRRMFDRLEDRNAPKAK